MKLAQHISISFILIGALSCSDPVDVPDVTNPDPVFTSSVNIDGKDFRLNAGEDDQHAVATYAEVGEDIIFTTTFKSQDCNVDCPGSLSFELVGAEANSGAFDVMRQVFPGRRPYFIPPPPADSVLVTLEDQSRGLSLAKVWEVNGREMEPIRRRDTLMFKIHRGKTSTICLTNYDRVGNQSRQCQTFNPSNLEVPRTTISVDDLSKVALSVQFIPPYDRAKVTGKWNVGNRTNDRIVLRDAEFFGKEVCYESVLTPNHRSTSCVKVGKGASEFEINSLFEVIDLVKLNAQPNRRGTVELTYIDDNGRKFISSAPTAGGGGQFEIVSTEIFEDQGQKWLKAEVRFDAILVALNGDKLDLRGGEAVIPIAFPQ